MTNGLNYNATVARPARGVRVEVVNSAGSVLASTITDAAGDYSLTTSSNTNVRIRARARLLKSTGATWDVTVRDNTSGNADYVLAGSLTSSGAANSTRNLNAASGWGGSSYTGVRAAAPFAILDAIYEALTQFEAIDAGIAFPALQVYWSVNNRPASGTIANGEIGTSFYGVLGGVPTIAVLGAANVDTDEYDRHVLVHEFGHYFEDQLARSDSPGGSHSPSARLDARLAFSEGWGNALSGIILGDPIYRDSLGAAQSTGFNVNVETYAPPTPGWFSEGSVQSIIYDVFDSADDGADALSAGLTPIYNAFVSPSFTNSPLAATIFLWAEVIRADPSVNTAAFDALISAQSINGAGPDGAGETNDGGIATSLPVYKTATVGGAAVVICSVDNAGTGNQLGVRNMIRVNVPTAGAYTLQAVRTSGDTGRDPDIVVLLNGVTQAAGISSVSDSETLNANLAAGDYVIDVYDFRNVLGNSPGDACFDFTIL